MKTLAERLKFAMENASPKKVKGVDLARAVGVKPPSVSDWLSGKSKKMEGENLLRAAKHLGVNPHWLASGTGDMQLGQSQSKAFLPPTGTELIDMPPASMPVISWVQAGDWTPVMASDLSNIIEWLPYDPRAGKNGFGLIVKGVSMEPMFKPDDRIYVNPTFQIDELNTGDLVVMACDGDCEATFKELVVESGRYYLRALNPNWHEKIMPVDHNCRLVGKVVGRYTIF